MNHAADRPQLRLIVGGLSREFVLAGVAISVIPADFLPDPLDARVREEDTDLVLSVETTLQEPQESVQQLTRSMAEFKPVEPGSVLLRRGQYLNMLAVIHDLNREPTWRESWISEALARVFELARKRGLRILALPLLGTLHGRLAPRRALAVLHRVLATYPPLPATKIWLQVRREHIGEVIAILEEVSAPIA